MIEQVLKTKEQFVEDLKRGIYEAQMQSGASPTSIDTYFGPNILAVIDVLADSMVTYQTQLPAMIDLAIKGLQK